MALSLNPAAVIVNLPSNDAAKLFSLDQTMDNFEAIVAAAEEVGVPVWVATTQPRNGFTSAQIDLQLTSRQAIEDAFLDRAIDFWTGFSNAEHGVLPGITRGLLFDFFAAMPGILSGADIVAGLCKAACITQATSGIVPVHAIDVFDKFDGIAFARIEEMQAQFEALVTTGELTTFF
jgi:hypothetical protein